MSEADLNCIVWGPRPADVSEDLWNERVTACNLIVGMGTVAGWINDQPAGVVVDSIGIVCIPSNGYYTVDEFQLSMPKTEEEIRRAVVAAKILRNVAKASKEQEKTMGSLRQLLYSGLAPEGIKLIIDALSDLKDLMD